MVIILVKCVYPAHIAYEIGKKWIEVMGKYPLDKTVEKMIVPAMVHAEIEGFTAYSVTNVKLGKYIEALDLATKRMLDFGQIKGFKYSINTLYDAVEAMTTLGMASPV